MRTIKFRAWDGKKMRAICELHWDTLGRFIKTVTDANYLLYPKDIELMQFTGLKDQHGKEIYEGDLLINHGVTNDMKQRIFKAVWNDTAARYSLKDIAANMYTSMDRNDTSRCEVIGNIYENPDLLKAAA